MHARGRSRVERLFKLKVSPTITAQDHSWQATQTPPTGGTAAGAGSHISLLAAVDFKWLMTGHGWWVDSARFHADPCYAATLLGLAIASPSSALRDCAARLLAQMGLPAGSKPLPDNRFAASGL